MRISLIGTRGVPARYGGFETAVEEIGQRLVARGHEVTVYCRFAADSTSSHLGMTLVHLPALRSRSAETLSHTLLSMLHLQRDPPDVSIVFNTANAPLLPLLRMRGIPVGLHVDGLEWRRSKWGRWARKYARAAERLAVRWSDELIADAIAIQSYYRREHAVGSRYIAYGARILDGINGEQLESFSLDSHSYHLVVARLEPENHVHMLIDGYLQSSTKLPLVIVGSVPYETPYVKRIRAAAAPNPNGVRLLGSIWDQDVLDALYANARTYLHGHSVGGTNPSLLRAMGAATPVMALDVDFNREVLGDTGRFFGEPSQLAALLDETDQDGDELAERGRSGKRRVSTHYDWDDVTDSYEQLCRDLASAPGRSRTRRG